VTSEVPTKTVEDHIRRFFAGHAITEHQWTLGPAPAAMPEFRILCAGPGPRTGCWTYLSIGASVITHDSSGSLEFFVVAPSEDLRHVELVTMVAWYHKTKALGWGHTVPIGHPWMPGSLCDHILISTLELLRHRIQSYRRWVSVCLRVERLLYRFATRNHWSTILTGIQNREPTSGSGKNRLIHRFIRAEHQISRAIWNSIGFGVNDSNTSKVEAGSGRSVGSRNCVQLACDQAHEPSIQFSQASMWRCCRAAATRGFATRNV